MDSLPKEIWLYIFRHLDGHSLQAVENVCQDFLEWLSDDIFWFQKCQQALATVNTYKPFSVERSQGKAAWKDLYLGLISPYKHLLGYWQRLTVDGESAVERGSGALLRFTLLPKLGLMYGHMTEYIESETCHRFDNAIIIHSDGEFSSHRPVERYPFGISKQEHLPLESCFIHEPVDDHSLHLHQVYASEVMEFEGLTDSEAPTKWLKLKPLTSFPTNKMKAGVFSALYDNYGTELIHVCHLASENLIVGTKLIGDGHVPFGKHTFVVDLSKPLTVGLSDQQTCEQLRDVVSTTSTEVSAQPQPFRLPDDMRIVDADYPFHTCLARYAGQITYAWNDYVDPSWHDMHYIQFSNDQFAILAVNDASILLFTRQPEMIF